MALVLNGTSQYLKLSSALVSASPLFICVWVKPTATTTTHELVNINSTTTNNSKDLYQSASAVAAEDLSNTGAGATTSSALTAGSWRFIAGLWLNATSRASWSDASTQTNSTSKTPTGLDNTCIGAMLVNNAAASLFFAGRLAQVAFWNSDQSANIAALRAGKAPSFFPSGLVAYLPLVGDASDTKGNAWSNIGSATFDSTDNPTITYPSTSSGLLLARRRRSA